jgi:DNA-directed RNA polymerase specialized sigma24 family protein
MREASGLTYDEIAVACELTPDAVRSRLHRARLQLRASLDRPMRGRVPTVRLHDRTRSDGS